MRLPSVPTLPMVEHLNDTFFHQVWNATQDHGRANFQLYKAAPRLQIGAVPVNLSVVGLPTTDTVYAVYRVPYDFFGRYTTLPDSVWTTDTAVVNQSGVMLTAYSATGRVIPFGQIFFRYDPVISQVLVAIPYLVSSVCTGETYPDLYMTVNKDTSRATPIAANTYMITSVAGSLTIAQGAITTAVSRFPHGTIVVVNGWVYDPAHVPTLKVGDVVEVVSDPDIVGYCDISVDDNQTGYYSTKFAEYREVLHVPRALNPDNLIITTDTIDVVVFDPVTHKGAYGVRVNPHALESITHQDYSMSRSVIQAFQNGLGATTVQVRIYVRYATQPKKLVEDANYILDMYTLDDTEILKQLVGESSNQIPEWSAPYLEQSSLLTLMHEFDGFGMTEALSKFTEAMGYYGVTSALAQSMRYYTYQGGQVEIIKPARLVGRKCNPIVYLNGRKIPATSIGVSDYDSRGFFLGFTADAHVPVGARIGVYIAEDYPQAPAIFTPTSSTPSILLDSDDYALFVAYDYTADQPTWEDVSRRGYREILPSPADYSVVVNSDGTATYKVKPVHYGSVMYLVPLYGLSTASFNLDPILIDKEAIVFPLEITDSAGNLIPAIGVTTAEVYINGYRIIEGIDYTLDPILGPNGDILQSLLVVSNRDYLQLDQTGNVMEVVMHGDVIASQDKGYVISNMMHRLMPPMLWSKSCGRVFAHGLLIENIEEMGTTVVSQDHIDDGSPYLLQWDVPYGVIKLMGSLSPNDDVSLKVRVDRVLGMVHPTYPQTVIIEHLYALYSPYLATIVNDVGNGTFAIVNDPKDDTFLTQFLPYADLLPRDPTLGSSNTLIDRRFVSLAAHYANFAVQDPVQMMMIQRLINLLLTPSELSFIEVLV